MTAALLVAAAATPAAAAPTARPAQAQDPVPATELRTPDGEALGNVRAINERGQVVAVMRDETSALGLTTVVWDRGRTTPVAPEGVAAVGLDISDRGQVVGTVIEGGFTFPPGTLGGENAGSLAINNRGHVVGHSQLATGAERGFVWRRGRMIDLGTLAEVGSICVGDVNDRGQVVGTATAGADGMDHAFLWENGRMTDLGTLGGRYSEAHAVNDHGQVVGRSERADGTVHAFVWEDRRMVDLGPDEPGFSQAVDVNDRGQIVGQIRTDTRDVAVMWTVPPSGTPPRPVG